MIRETTLNVHKSIAELIDELAETTNKKRNDIIILFFKYAMRESKFFANNNQSDLVSYQERDPLKEWEKVHVWYNDAVSVFVSDLRGFGRWSCSKVLAYSVCKYMGVLLKKLLKRNRKKLPDKYRYINYKFNRYQKYIKTLWTNI